MIVEILRFLIASGRRSEFIRRNEEVWTPALRKRPDFLRREILVSDENPDLTVILIYWKSRAGVDAFPAEEESRLDEKMPDLVRRREQVVLERVLPAEEDRPDPGNGESLGSLS